MDSKDVDILVIGAGIFGIAAARAYLEVHPGCQLVMLEQDTTPGGVWNSTRSYPAFWSQTGLRMAEFSDVPLTIPTGEETYYDLFDAKNLTRYLEEYVDNHIYAEKSIRNRIVFGFSVLRVTKIDGIWNIEGAYSAGEDEDSISEKDSTSNDKQAVMIYRSSKLIVATGTASIPYIPDLPRQEEFRGQIIHQKAFGNSSVLTDPNIKNITILGGAKSAADMVYASVKAGKAVSWVIRRSGKGPAAFTAAEGKGPYANAPELASTRILSTLSPSCFTPQNWWTRFLHGTSNGRNILSKVWSSADKTCRDAANYHGRSGARKGFENLESNTNIFWCNGPLGLIQRPDFWEVMSQNVQIYRSDVLSMGETSLNLVDGSEVPTDVLLCGTGWKQAQNHIFDDSDILRLGLPHTTTTRELPEDESLASEEALWAQLEQAADAKVLSQFPMLANPPKATSPATDKPTRTPYRLYNCIAPLSDSSIAFVGQVLLSNMFRGAEVQALWATAFLDGKLAALALPSKDVRREEVAYVNAFCRRRYPTNGQLGIFFHFDTVGYTDKLLRELGLNSHRNQWWWDDLTKACTASDLKDVIEKYKEKYGYEVDG